MSISLLLGLSWPAILFGFVVPVGIFCLILLAFKLVVRLFRSLRDRRWAREYEAEKRARAASEAQEKREEP